MPGRPDLGASSAEAPVPDAEHSEEAERKAANVLKACFRMLTFVYSKPASQLSNWPLMVSNKAE